MTASFFDHHIICSHCGAACDTMALTQNKGDQRYEFEGEAIHVECYVRLLVEAHIEKLLDHKTVPLKNQEGVLPLKEKSNE